MHCKRTAGPTTYDTTARGSGQMLVFGQELRHQRKVPLAGAAFETAGGGARPWALSAKNTKRLHERDRVGATGPVAPTCEAFPFPLQASARSDGHCRGAISHAPTYEPCLSGGSEHPLTA